jgi:hypothetical protein
VTEVRRYLAIREEHTERKTENKIRRRTEVTKLKILNDEGKVDR